MPISAEPVTLPKIEIGHPMYKEKCCNDGINLDNILLLLDQYDKPEPPPVYPQPQPIFVPPPPPRQPIPKKRRELLNFKIENYTNKPINKENLINNINLKKTLKVINI